MSETSADDEGTEVPSQRRVASPTPVSHVGASARTVAPSRLPTPAEPALQTPPRSRWMLVLSLAAVGVLLLAGVGLLIGLPLADRLGSWAASPEQGAQSPLEPVQDIQP